MTIPTMISHGWNSPVPEESSRYRLLFDWVGTDDFSPWLVVPDALEAVSAAEAGGWPAVMKRNHELALQAMSLLSEILPLADSFLRLRRRRNRGNGPKGEERTSPRLATD
jgi:isopenicillin-N epimerase